MALVIAAVLFAIFAANVVAGSLFGGPIVGDVSEMLILFASCIAFVAGILAREEAAGDAEEEFEP